MDERWLEIILKNFKELCQISLGLEGEWDSSGIDELAL
jgi:hypothetical protein